MFGWRRWRKSVDADISNLLSVNEAQWRQLEKQADLIDDLQRVQRQHGESINAIAERAARRAKQADGIEERIGHMHKRIDGVDRRIDEVWRHADIKADKVVDLLAPQMAELSAVVRKLSETIDAVAEQANIANRTGELNKGQIASMADSAKWVRSDVSKLAEAAQDADERIEKLENAASGRG